jgi:hypothetical protein
LNCGKASEESGYDEWRKELNQRTKIFEPAENCRKSLDFKQKVRRCRQRWARFWKKSGRQDGY